MGQTARRPEQPPKSREGGCEGAGGLTGEHGHHPGSAERRDKCAAGMRTCEGGQHCESDLESPESPEQVFKPWSTLWGAPRAKALRPGQRRWTGVGWSLPPRAAVGSRESKDHSRASRGPLGGWVRRGTCPCPLGLQRALTRAGAGLCSLQPPLPGRLGLCSGGLSKPSCGAGQLQGAAVSCTDQEAPAVSNLPAPVHVGQDEGEGLPEEEQTRSSLPH